MNPADGIGELLLKAFEYSPFAGVAAFGAMWLITIWVYKVFTGVKDDLPGMILTAFSVAPESEPMNLVALMDRSAALVPADSRDWRVGDVMFLFWTLRVLRWVVLVFSTLLLICGLALLVMYLAQPAEGISLGRVSNVFTPVFIFCLVVLCVLSVMKSYGSINRLPKTLLSDQQAWKVILFAF